MAVAYHLIEPASLYSIASYGAVARSSADQTSRFTAALAATPSTEGGLYVPRQGIDISCAHGSRVKVTENNVRDCAGGMELKFTTTETAYTDVLVDGNVFTASDNAS